MIKKIQLSILATALTLSTSAIANDSVNTVAEMFSKGTTSGQVRLGYFGAQPDTTGDKSNYVTAIGGQLKFETASFNGLSLGTAMYTSHTINALSGNDSKFHDSMTSSEKHYTELAEAYINYTANGFNIRIGRQVLDTPLADSDDIRMTPHTFEAYLASYTMQDLGLTFIGANLQRWQGVDSDYASVLNNQWDKTGEDGTWIAAALYANDTIEAGLWYYDITKSLQAVYADASATYTTNTGASLTLATQYLTESETNNSGVDGSIVGIMAEGSHNGLTLALAYDKVNVDNGKAIFEGFGGGSSYTNMDTMTAGSLHDGTYGDGSSYVASLSYEIMGANVVAAYGDFKANDIGAGKAHVTELDLGVEYALNDNADMTLYYIQGTDKESTAKTEADENHLQVTFNYNF